MKTMWRSSCVILLLCFLFGPAQAKLVAEVESDLGDASVQSDVDDEHNQDQDTHELKEGDVKSARSSWRRWRRPKRRPVAVRKRWRRPVVVRKWRRPVIKWKRPKIFKMVNCRYWANAGYVTKKLLPVVCKLLKAKGEKVRRVHQARLKAQQAAKAKAAKAAAAAAKAAKLAEEEEEDAKEENKVASAGKGDEGEEEEEEEGGKEEGEEEEEE
eukprot:TRINITY_DN89_c0_g1_i4.p1 TRINITY_DN89_c0_g1~~TRINITY_DN89_c0_g1_i4.p1  ORF type:complete len:213 (-),score=58.65 TRINITY_DN89_c0_g1_i4:221-859(-)